MIRFRQKPQSNIDLYGEVISRLNSEKIRYKEIDSSEINDVAKLNTKQMILDSAMETTQGTFRITVFDKNSVVNGEVYPYTKKLLERILGMRVIDTPNSSSLSVECDYLGVMLDVVEVLARRYQLSIVKRND